MPETQANAGIQRVDANQYGGFSSLEQIKLFILNTTNTHAMHCDTELFTSGLDAFIDIDKELEEAQKKIRINVFIWSNDSTGLRIAKQLIAAHLRGVDVEVNVDKMGSLVMGNHYLFGRWRLYLILKLLPRVIRGIFRYNVRYSTILRLLSMTRDASAIYALDAEELAKIEKISAELISDEMFLKMHDVLKLMQEEGLKLHINANPLRKIDHSKVIILDEATSYIGGMNIMDVCSGGYEENAGWTGRVERNYHKDYWLKMRSRHMAGLLAHYYFNTHSPADFSDVSQSGATELILLRNAPGFAKPGTDEFYSMKQITFVIEFLLKIARKHIVIEHAYLMNDNIGMLLAEAANRGVEIEIIRSAKQHITTETAYDNFLNKLNSLIRQQRRNNLHIRRHPNILHSKVLAVDDFTVIGSANLSMESLLYHDELSLLVYNNDLQRRILEHLKQSIMESRFKRLFKGPRRRYAKEIPFKEA